MREAAIDARLPMPVCEEPDFLDLPPPVAALFAQAAERSFFALPLWYHTLARYGIEKPRPRLYLDAATPRAALVCRVDPSGARRLLSLSSYFSCEHGPLLDPTLADPAAALTAIAAAFAAERPAWDSLQIAALDPRDPGYDGLAAAFRRTGWSVHRYFDSGCWYEETGGMDFARYLAERPAALRNTGRRKAAKLAAAHRAETRFYATPDGLDQGIADYETVYRASWKEGEEFPDFMPQLITAAANCGALRLGILTIDGIPAAAQLWLLWRGRATIFKLAHDSRFDALSAGTLLTMQMMERVLEEDRPAEVNFGRGDDPYKKLWLPKRRERWGLLALNPRTPRGLALSLREGAAALFRRPREPSR